ncbi:MAG: glycosyltransferase family 4 protein [Candidatus Eisenbacteria sp.]|nr:glycosyltransferase family 4 protein [Candidatus Eisenbacteria bacterium]
MQILMANSFHYERGGDCTYTFALTRLLESKGHRVIPFATRHPLNLPSEYDTYFAPAVDYDQLESRGGLRAAVRVLRRAISSREAREALERLLAEIRPDLAHFQGIHRHLTPSIIGPLRSAGVPIVWTLHDYVPICPNTHFYCRGEICEACRPGRFYRAPLRRCKRDSMGASLAAAVEAYAHRRQRVYSRVDHFIAPSRFLARKLVEHRFPSTKVTVVPHFMELDRFKPTDQDEGFALFAGRLAEEKGLRTLIEAKARLGSGDLRIAGDGPLREEMEATVARRGISGVRFVGLKTREEVRELASRARCLILPSIWYENFPFAVMEAFALGKPMLASRIGAIPDLVTENEDGLLFRAGDAGDLAEKLGTLLADRELAVRLGASGRAKAETEWSPQAHWQRLNTVYQSVLKPSG